MMRFEPDIAVCLPSLFFSHRPFVVVVVVVVLTFQTLDVRMAVIGCCKAVTQSHSSICTTCLEVLYSAAHAPSSKKRDFSQFDWWRVDRVKGSQYQKTVGKLSGPVEFL